MKKWIFAAGAAALGIGAVIGVKLYKKAQHDAVFADDMCYATSPVRATPASPVKSAPAPEVKPAADEVKNGETRAPKDNKPKTANSGSDAAAKLVARQKANKAKKTAETQADKPETPEEKKDEKVEAAAETEVPAPENTAEEPEANKAE